MIRSILGRVLGPLVDSVLDRLEQSSRVLEQHELVRSRAVRLRRLQDQLDAETSWRARLASAAISRVVSDASGLLLPNQETVPDVNDPLADLEQELHLRPSVGPGRFETDRDLQIIQLAAIAAGGTNERRSGTDWDSYLGARAEGASWGGSSADAARARVFVTYALSSLRCGLVRPHVVAELLPRTCEGFTPENWFTSGTPLYGSSAFLRCLIHLSEAEGSSWIDRYLRRVLERLLRHVEVKRADSLVFDAWKLPPDACPLLERVRFTLAMLKAARILKDLRFLNAALKMNDAYLGPVKRIRPPGALDDQTAVSLLVVLNYIRSISEQERQISTLA